MKKFLIWFGGAIVTAAVIWAFLIFSAGYMMSSVFPVPSSPARISGSTRLVILPISETAEKEGLEKPRLKIPDNLIRWILPHSVTTNFVYAGLKDWVKSGCHGEPNLIRGNNNLDDIVLKIAHVSEERSIVKMINIAMSNPKRVIIPSSETEKNAGLERFYIDIKDDDYEYPGLFGYYWINKMTGSTGTYIKTLLDDGPRKYIDLILQTKNLNIEAIFPEHMIGEWQEIKSNVDVLVSKWSDTPFECKGTSKKL